MHSRKAKLAKPLNIDVSKIASFFPEFRYREPSEDMTSEYIMNDANMDKFQALLFDNKTKNGFTTITSDYSPEELAALFTKLPDELSQPLKEALKGTPLQIPTLSPAMLARYKLERAEEQKKEVEFKKLQKPLENTKPVDFKAHQAVTVLQHEYALTTADSNQPVLGTFGAGPCLILALYDESTKTAILAHIDTLTNIQSLSQLFYQLSKEHTVAHLAGGDSSSKNMCLSVVEMLQRNNIKIVNADIVHSGFGDSASLAIDARTGTIYSPVMHHQLERTTDLDFRLQIAGLQFLSSPLRECYNSHKPSKKQKLPVKPVDPELTTPVDKKLESIMPNLLDEKLMITPSRIPSSRSLHGPTGILLAPHVSLSLLSSGARKAKKIKDNERSLIEAKLNLIFGKKFSVVSIFSDEHTVDISPQPTYETVKQFVEKLKTGGLSTEVQSPCIFDDGFVAVPAKLKLIGSRAEVLEKLDLMIAQDASLQASSKSSMKLSVD